MIPFLLVIIAVLSYGLGALNGALLLSRFVFHKDLRKHGSGKITYANFCRVFGNKWGAAVIAVDVLKSAIAVMAGGLFMMIIGPQFVVIGKIFAGLWTTLGQIYPVQQQFHGNKGVVSFFTALWLTDWSVGLVMTGVFVIVVAFSQYVSLASMSACAVAAVATWVFVAGDELKGLAGTLVLFMALVIVWRQRGSVIRLLQNKEPRVKWGKQPDKRIREDNFL